MLFAYVNLNIQMQVNIEIYIWYAEYIKGCICNIRKLLQQIYDF